MIRRLPLVDPQHLTITRFPERNSSVRRFSDALHGAESRQTGFFSRALLSEPEYADSQPGADWAPAGRVL